MPKAKGPDVTTTPKRKKREGVFKRTDRKGWFISYVDAAGKRIKEKVEASTKTQALNLLNHIKTREERDKALGVKTASEITTTDLLARYKRHQKHHLKPTTFVRLDGMLKTLGANLPTLAKDITRQDVARYISERSETMKPGTVIKEVNALKHCLRLAVEEWELLNTNVAHGAKLPKVGEGRTRYLTPAELKAALLAAPEWMRAPMALAAFTGMRRGELLSLRWKDVDMQARQVFLLDTKNGSMRVIALNSLACDVIASLPVGKPADLLLPGVDPEKLTVYTRRVFHSVGIMDASFHTLRHSCASWLVMQGADLYAVGGILGHKTPRMTQRYAHLSPGFQTATVSRLDGGVL